jgi:Zn-dependent protease
MFGSNLNVAEIISRVVILLVSLPLHELAHAVTANAFGDDTPRLNGRLTLNPLAHLDPLGSLLIVVGGFGWAKPVPINPYALSRRSRSAVMWVSLAGPMANFLQAVVAAIPIRFRWITYGTASGGLLPSPYEFLIDFIAINLLLAVFNLIPLAPLDGDKIADYFLPDSWSRALERIRPYGPLILLALLFVGPMVGLDIFGWLIRPVLYTLMHVLGVY